VLAGRVWKLSQNDNEILYSTYGGSICSSHHSFKTDFHSHKDGKRIKKKSVHDLNQSSKFQIAKWSVVSLLPLQLYRYEIQIKINKNSFPNENIYLFC
jgi:hypothetical protein